MLQFHSPAQTVAVPGPQLHHLHAYCAALCASALGLDPFQLYLEPPVRLKRLLPPGAPPLRAETPDTFYRELADYLLLSHECLRHPATGRSLEIGALIYNTALVSGSDPVRLLARLSGQAHRHLYVEGPHRAWLAGIIDEGMESGVLRRFRGHGGEESGWPAVVALLRARDGEPVVLCDGAEDHVFPSAAFGAPFVPPAVARSPAVEWAPMAGARPEWAGDEEEALFHQWERSVWHSLPPAEQWDYAMLGLRQFLAHELELKPENWRTFRFDHGHDAFQLLAATYV